MSGGAPMVPWHIGGVRLLFAGLLAGCGASGTESRPPYAQWRRLPAPLTAFRESGRAVLNGRLYAFGGYATADLKATRVVQAYDPALGRWVERAPMPVALTHTNAVTLGGTVWFAGGFVGDGAGPVTDGVWRYVASLDRWLRGPSLPAPRGGGALAVTGRRLHYFGGFESDRDSESSEHWVLDPDSGTGWRTAAPMPLARGQLGAVTLGGTIYAVGGQFGHDRGARDLARVHRYHPATDRWSEATPLPHPLSHAEGSTFEAGGEILVLGGRDNRNLGSDADPILRDMLAYDPRTDLWLDLGELPRTNTGPVAAVLGDELVVAGGGTGSQETAQRDAWALRFRDAWRPRPDLPAPLRGVAAAVIGRYLYLVGDGHPGTLRYDLATAQWLAADALSSRPFLGHHHAAEAWEGRLYLFGGVGAEGCTQIYVPQSDSWKVGAPVPFNAGSSAAAVIGGRIYLAGGLAGAEATGEAAVYDPATDTWQRIAPLPHPRHGAAGGTDGRRFFLFGGQGSGDRSAAGSAAEVQVYDPLADRWILSGGAVAAANRLPEPRVGAGKAVFLNGRFYVLGGGIAGRGVVDRVDIYDPEARTWRRGNPMPVPRQGIFPVMAFHRILVAGGQRADGSASAAFDYYTPSAAP
jgi:N-acetylneuraminic acid mutarotase